MSQPPQDEQSFLAYLIGLAGLGIAGILAWLGKNTMKRIADLETGKASSAELAAVIRESERHRAIEAKIFDMMREHERQDSDRFTDQERSSRERHDELMTVVGDLRVDIAGLKR